MINLFFDAVFINVSFILAYYLRFNVFLFIAPSSAPFFEKYIEIMVFITLLWLSILKLAGVYDGKKITALIDELALLFLGISASAIILFGLLFLYRELWFSRLVVVNAWWIAFLVLSLVRIISFQMARTIKRKGLGVKNVLLLGAGEMGQTLANKLSQDRGLGYRVVGYLDDDASKTGKSFFGIPVFGSLSIVKETVIKYKIGEIIIASSKIPANITLDVITECEKYGISFKIVPGILELIASRVDADEIAGIPLLNVSEIRLQGISAGLKRLVDIIFSLVGLLLLLPLFVVVALMIKITSPGPVFFRQERIGLDGWVFRIFKFRSMVEDAENKLKEVEPVAETRGHLFKMKKDPRITRFGRFIRRCSIDELPQLINVFMGDMSLVGPRPPLPREVEKYNSWQKKRLRVRPGITGSWQVSGRSLLPFDDMVRLDIYYIENWSLWLDTKILLRTIPVVIMGGGAY